MKFPRTGHLMFGDSRSDLSRRRWIRVAFSRDETAHLPNTLDTFIFATELRPERGGKGKNRKVLKMKIMF